MQFADDNSLNIDGIWKTLQCLLNLLDQFTKLSGLNQIHVLKNKAFEVAHREEKICA